MRYLRKIRGRCIGLSLFFVVLFMVQAGMCVFVPVAASLMMEVTGDKGLYVHGMDENGVFSYTAHAPSQASSHIPYRYAYALSPEGSVVSLSAPRMIGFTREMFFPFHDLSSCIFDVPVRGMPASAATRWLLEDGAFRMERDAYRVMTSWDGRGPFMYASREEGECPRVYHMQTTGNSSGNISHSFFVWWL
ncbi:MAG: hypothetical protein FWF19_01145 [Euryarchaeota archaeon]|nr:hypothetical protein [Euryarchaeota archaeon]